MTPETRRVSRRGREIAAELLSRSIHGNFRRRGMGEILPSPFSGSESDEEFNAAALGIANVADAINQRNSDQWRDDELPENQGVSYSAYVEIPEYPQAGTSMPTARPPVRVPQDGPDDNRDGLNLGTGTFGDGDRAEGHREEVLRHIAHADSCTGPVAPPTRVHMAEVQVQFERDEEGDLVPAGEVVVNTASRLIDPKHPQPAGEPAVARGDETIADEGEKRSRPQLQDKKDEKWPPPLSKDFFGVMSTEAKDNIARIMCCVVCESPPRVLPICTCESGHALCVECHLHLTDTRCPVCRSSLLIRGKTSGLKPNEALSRMYMNFLEGMTFECINASRGCKKKDMDFQAIPKHEIFCSEQIIECPIMSYAGPCNSQEFFGPNCMNIKSVKELAYHIKQDHPRGTRQIVRSYATPNTKGLGEHIWHFIMSQKMTSSMTGIPPVICIAYETIPAKYLNKVDDTFETLCGRAAIQLEEATKNPLTPPHPIGMAWVFARCPLHSIGTNNGVGSVTPLDQDKELNFSVFVNGSGLPPGCIPMFILNIRYIPLRRSVPPTKTTNKYCTKILRGRASIWNVKERDQAMKRMEMIGRKLEHCMNFINNTHRLEDTDELSFPFRTLRLGERNRVQSFELFGDFFATLRIDFRHMLDGSQTKKVEGVGPGANKDEDDDDDDSHSLTSSSSSSDGSTFHNQVEVAAAIATANGDNIDETDKDAKVKGTSAGTKSVV